LVGVASGELLRRIAWAKIVSEENTPAASPKRNPRCSGDRVPVGVVSHESSIVSNGIVQSERVEATELVYEDILAIAVGDE
jgi:hypothetical protein